MIAALSDDLLTYIARCWVRLNWRFLRNSISWWSIPADASSVHLTPLRSNSFKSKNSTTPTPHTNALTKQCIIPHADLRPNIHEKGSEKHNSILSVVSVKELQMTRSYCKILFYSKIKLLNWEIEATDQGARVMSPVRRADKSTTTTLSST